MKHNLQEYLTKINTLGELSHPPTTSYKALFKAIANGDREFFQDEFFKKGLVLGIFPDNPLQEAKYMCVLVLGIFAYTCVMKNMSSELIFNTSDFYILCIDAAESCDDIVNITYNAYDHFCALINRNKNSKSSPITRKIISYINNNLYKKIQVCDIAEALEMSSSYISTVFKKEMNVGIIEYSHRLKLVEAKKMLVFADSNLTSVAEALGYDSLSHFSKTCKKYLNCSPSKLSEISIEDMGNLGELDR